MSAPLYERTTESLERLAQAIRDGMDVMKDYDIAYHRVPLALAAMKGNAEACRLLLDAGANPHRSRAWVDGPSPICEVIRSVHGNNDVGPGLPAIALSIEDARAVIRVLIECGASIDGPPAPERSYRTFSQSPLHLAVEAADHETVTLLAEFGADMDMDALVPEAGGTPMSPLGRAEFMGDQKMMITLLRHGANDVYLGRSAKGHTPIAACVYAGLNHVVKYYIKERGEDLAQRVDGRTLLQIARNADTRALLRSLKTELAVQNAINVSGKDCPSDRAGHIILGAAKRCSSPSL